ncbi:MAG: choice-of-anchor D domain-containing protein [Acidobacteria bacterium]|nr:choice-of-anchor D domain-containing protein [Acidobacteriota bacterium]
MRLLSCVPSRFSKGEVLRGTMTALGVAMLTMPATSAFAQACSGPYCLDQKQLPPSSCPAGQRTTITGHVYAPNGVDPLPNIMVYVPNGPVDAFTPGVSCDLPGKAPSGFPLIGTATRVDGSFTLDNAPVDANVPIVIQSGRWRRQVKIAAVTGCTANNIDISMPKDQSEGDIPLFAMVTGNVDGLECVLRKAGIADTEFTDPAGGGRIQFYRGISSPGASISSSTPSASVLMDDANILNQYDVAMMACEGTAGMPAKTPSRLQNLLDFANKGGRVFATHWDYTWFYNNGDFGTAANWRDPGTSGSVSAGTAKIDVTFPDGKTLAEWLNLIGASTTYGQIPLNAVFSNQTGVNSPTQSWLTLGTNVMQLTFNTPVRNAAGQQCGRVLYNDYHVDGVSGAGTKTFPAECSPGDMTPQEKLLEYSLFNLSGGGAEPSISPDQMDFGRSAVGVQTAGQLFTWTNSTIFPVYVSSVTPTGDFVVTQDNCSGKSVAAAGTCTIAVAFKPTALGTRTGSVSVDYSGTGTPAVLTGTGVPALESTPVSIDFGKLDVTATSTPQLVTVTNNTPNAIALNPVAVTGDYIATGCAGAIPAYGKCSISVSFHPMATGPRAGTVMLAATNPALGSISATLNGTGVDFAITVNPDSGSVIAGYDISTTGAVTSIAGYSGTVQLSCTMDSAGSTCTPGTTSLAVSSTSMFPVNITTTAKYTVIGYGGLGGGLLLTLFGTGGGLLLWLRRRDARGLARAAVFVLLASVLGFGATGCSGKLPDLNSPYTAPGSYTYTITATDGILTHSATFKLKVTASK